MRRQLEVLEDRGLDFGEDACNKCGMLRDDWFENGGKGVMRGETLYCGVLCAYDDAAMAGEDRRVHAKHR